MSRPISIFILLTVSSLGVLNVSYPQATNFNLLLALGIGVVFSYVDDLFKVSEEVAVEEKTPAQEEETLIENLVPRRKKKNV